MTSPIPARLPFVAAGDLRLDEADAALLVVDFQERLAAVMDPTERARCERNITILIELARRLAMPVVVSEQYPKGLGPTVAALAAQLGMAGALVTGDATARPPALPAGYATRFEKVAFGCTAEPGFDDVLASVGRTQWIVVGMETHICVYQTARGLAARGLRVHVPADAVISRSADHRAVGLDLLGRAGALVTTTETVAFDALKVAGTDDFRAISRLVR
jgi:nicotinamidase-related amidase